jgi:hypothetical protein
MGREGLEGVFSYDPANEVLYPLFGLAAPKGLTGRKSGSRQEVREQVGAFLTVREPGQ